MKILLEEIKACTICEKNLPHGCRPVVSAHKLSKIVVIGQAPGRVVHETGIPWDDKSGDNLRKWLGVTKSEFYDPKLFALIPMGFCYPGTGKTGDLPPRKECAPEWHNKLFKEMNNVKLVLLIGQYAQKYYLQKNMKQNLTETVKEFEQYLPTYLPLPHPSPRNAIWQKKNPWFAEKLLPTVAETVQKIIRK